jgi:hypothetical protein
VIKEREALGVSFELPDRLTVDQLDNYQQCIGQYLNNYKDQFLSNTRYRAMIFAAAVEAGLISQWQSSTMPTLEIDEVGQADAQVILYVGKEIEDYITAYTTISPN